MKCKRYIGLIALILCASLARAQQVLDTVCIIGNPSHLAVPETPGSHYEWNIKGGQIISGRGSHDVLVKWDVQPGTFPVSVTETDSNGCVGDPVHAYINLSLPNQALIDGPNKVCQGETVILRGIAGDDFVWIGGKQKEALEFTAIRDTVIFLVALNGPCKNDTFYHRIDVVDPPHATLFETPDTIRINTEVDLFYTDNTAETVEWLLNGYSLGKGYYLSHQFSEEGEQLISQIVALGNCTDTLQRKIYVIDDFAVHIPSAFTPNDDGINDVFIFGGVGIRSYTAEIYNRWGTLIHRWTESTEEGWNGTYRNQVSPGGTYIYNIVVRDFRGTEHKYTGAVNLVR